jgi:hypothetical protein
MQNQRLEIVFHIKIKDNLSSNVDGLDPLPPGRVSEERVAVVGRKEGCAEACSNSGHVISALSLT